jgi:hypothetical protein
MLRQEEWPRRERPAGSCGCSGHVVCVPECRCLTDEKVHVWFGSVLLHEKRVWFLSASWHVISQRHSNRKYIAHIPSRRTWLSAKTPLTRISLLAVPRSSAEGERLLSRQCLVRVRSVATCKRWPFRKAKGDLPVHFSQSPRACEVRGAPDCTCAGWPTALSRRGCIGVTDRCPLCLVLLAGKP